MSNETTLLRPAEVAERLKLAPRTVYRLVETGELAVVYVGRRRAARVRVSDLDAYLRAHEGIPAAAKD